MGGVEVVLWFQAWLCGRVLDLVRVVVADAVLRDALSSYRGIRLV